MSHFAIAGLQLNLENGDNFERLADSAADTMQRFPWVQLIMFSELALTGWSAQPQPLPGALEDQCRKLAKQLGVWLLNGSIYEKTAERNYNTATVIAPNGEVVGRYRKMFPFTPYEKGVAAGTNFLVFDVPDVGRFGVSICYDMWFPETSRTLAWMGAEVILHPTLTNTLDRDVELSIARATAATNQCYFFDINAASPLGYGRSIIVGPEGDVMHQGGSAQEVIALELDLGRVRRSRERGLLGLGQPLKSFRDCEIEFPPYGQDHTASLALRQLGPLEKPGPIRSRRSS